MNVFCLSAELIKSFFFYVKILGLFEQITNTFISFDNILFLLSDIFMKMEKCISS